MSETNGHTNGHNGNGHKPRRRYSDKERATALAALAANGGNVLRTARDTGIPRKTVELWAKEQAGGTLMPDVAAECQEIKGDLASELEAWAWQLLNLNREPAEARKARYQERSNGIGIAIEKSRLLREQPTSITGTDAIARGRKLIADYKAQFQGADDAEAIAFLAPEFPEVRELGKIG